MIFILIWCIFPFTWNVSNRTLLVNIYMLSDVDFVDDCIYIMWMMMTWWIVCVNICIVVESYVHAFMTCGDKFYIQLRWLWCAVGIMGDGLDVVDDVAWVLVVIILDVRCECDWLDTYWWCCELVCNCWMLYGSSIYRSCY